MGKKQNERKFPKRMRPNKKAKNPILEARERNAAWEAKVQERLEIDPRFKKKELRAEIKKLDAQLGLAVRNKDSELIQETYDKRAEAVKALRRL